MKTRINIICFVCFIMFWAITLRAQNTMTIPNASGNARDTVEVSVEIDNTDEFVAFQLSLKLPAQLSYLEGSAALTGRKVDHTISAGIVAGDSLRIFAYSENGTAFSGTSGSVATFKLILGTIPGTFALNPNNAIIGDANSNNILTGVTNGQLTLYAPEINLNTNTLNYTRTIVGTYRDMTFTILNNGNATLTIDSFVAAPSPTFTVVPGWSTTVSASGSQVITVRFTPPSRGNFTGTVTVYTDDPDEPSLNINLSGIGYKVNELRVNNLSVRSDTDTTLTFRINNQELFTGFQFDLTLPNAMIYLADSEQLTNRADGHSVDASVVTGGKLRVVVYSANHSTFSESDGDVVKVGFHVEGTGGSYSLPLSNVIITDSSAENILSDYYNGQLSIAAGDIQTSSSLNYGSVSILDTAKINLSIQNVGDDTLLINNVTSNDAHFWPDVSLPLKINPSQQTVIPTYFHGDTAETFNGKYTIRGNDPDEDPYYISTSATAYSPNIMQIENATAVIGGTVEIYVSIANHDPFTAFQLDIDFPSPLSVILDSTKLTNRRQDHVLNNGLISGNKYRFFAYSSSIQEFTGSSGAVLRILCNVSGSTGNYPLQIQNPIIGNAQGANIWSNSVDGSLIVSNPVLAKIKVWLEGAYQAGGSMTTNLSGSFPNQSPYGDARTVGSVPSGVTDWVSVELRSAPSGTAVSQRSFFLKANGNIVDEDGTTTALTMPGVTDDDYYIVIRHRNHLAIMSTSAVALSSSSSTLYDFTTGSGQYYGSGGAKELELNVWGMWSGDINQDGEVTTSDFTQWFNSARAGDSGYKTTDVNLDAQVTTSDFTKWFNNARAGASSGVP